MRGKQAGSGGSKKQGHCPESGDIEDQQGAAPADLRNVVVSGASQLVKKGQEGSSGNLWHICRHQMGDMS